MTELHITHHAQARMRQRGFREVDLDLILSVATAIADDAFLLTEQDAARAIRDRKREIQQIERLRGSKVIIEGNTLITLYHTAPKARLAKCGKGTAQS